MAAPYANRGNVDEATKAFSDLIVVVSDPSGVLQLVKTRFDIVA